LGACGLADVLYRRFGIAPEAVTAAVGRLLATRLESTPA
jgi:hypothetical protein